MKKILFSSLVILLINLSGCDASSVLNQEDKTVKFYNDQYQVTVPGHWSNMNLHDDADFQHGHGRKEAYMIVFTEPKVDFGDDYTLQEYKDLTFGMIQESLENSKIIKNTNLRLNGNDVLQAQIVGLIDNIKIHYLFNAIEDEKNFHQVIFWSLPSKYESNQKDFIKTLRSFKNSGT